MLLETRFTSNASFAVIVFQLILTASTVVADTATHSDENDFRFSTLAATAPSACFGEQKLTALDGTFADQLGTAVAVDGNTAVAGAPGDDEPLSNSGAAYVFVRAGTEWFRIQKLVPPDPSDEARFGFSVAIDGDTIIVGSDTDDDLGEQSGSAYVFERMGSRWTFAQKITASDGQAGDSFGSSVAIDGSTVVVGAFNRFGEEGKAYVFGRDPSGQLAEQSPILRGNPSVASDFFGHSVAIDHDTIAVGAPRDEAAAGNTSGAVYIFDRSGSTWVAGQKITAADAAIGHFFGQHVDIRDDVLAIAAPGDDIGTGAAYVFARVDRDWNEVGKIYGEGISRGDEFGALGVATNGEVVVVGANTSDAGFLSGSAHVFALVEGIWDEIQRITASDAEAGDGFGVPAISGSTLVIGAPGDDDAGDLGVHGNGALYVFNCPIGLGFEVTPELSRSGSCEIVTVRVSLNNRLEPVSAFSFGLAYDPSVLRPESCDMSTVLASLNNGDGPGAFDCDVDPWVDECDSISAGMTVNAFLPRIDGGPVDAEIPPGLGQELLIARFSVVEGVEDGTQTALSFTDCLRSTPTEGGVVEITPCVIVVSGESRRPQKLPGSTFVARCFSRGDCNADGAFDLADPDFLLRFLFSSGKAPACTDGCDSNDDGRVDISDVVFKLLRLFVGGAGRIPDPSFPQCGIDRTGSTSERCAYPEQICGR